MVRASAMSLLPMRWGEPAKAQGRRTACTWMAARDGGAPSIVNPVPATKEKTPSQSDMQRREREVAVVLENIGFWRFFAAAAPPNDLACRAFCATEFVRASSFLQIRKQFFEFCNARRKLQISLFVGTEFRCGTHPHVVQPSRTTQNIAGSKCFRSIFVQSENLCHKLRMGPIQPSVASPPQDARYCVSSKGVATKSPFLQTPPGLCRN